MESIPSRVEAVLVLRISDINLMKHKALIAPVSLSQQERGPLLSSQSLNSFNCSGTKKSRDRGIVGLGGGFPSVVCFDPSSVTENTRRQRDNGGFEPFLRTVVVSIGGGSVVVSIGGGLIGGDLCGGSVVVLMGFAHFLRTENTRRQSDEVREEKKERKENRKKNFN
ncbi:hypothetical protein F2Q70_00018062 [Brassica cretica]|uniref:Uncharacterized protein n=1 Tax=Brassica cretica TaxID=69181 RepID=A0A8S9I2P5_BRACR|nr:hypothetical protein F2Q70_00018062 [Brassica cretica]